MPGLTVTRLLSPSLPLDTGERDTAERAEDNGFSINWESDKPSEPEPLTQAWTLARAIARARANGAAK
jgi:hypothetical protein